jgi:hypothetical protein
MRRERQRQRQKLFRTLVSFFETWIFFGLFCDLLDRFEGEQKAKALSTPSLFAIAVTVSFVSWKHKIGYGGLASELRWLVLLLLLLLSCFRSALIGVGRGFFFPPDLASSS